MRRVFLDIFVSEVMVGVAALASASPSDATWWRMTEIVDQTGDGGGQGC